MKDLIAKIKYREKPIAVQPRLRKDNRKNRIGIWMEFLLLYAGVLGYIFCNITALDMSIPLWVGALITAGIFGLTVLLAWYKRVFFSVLGAGTVITLLAFPVTFPLIRKMIHSLNICYNYTIYLLGMQDGFSGYLDRITVDLDGVLTNPVLLQRHFYTAIIVLTVVVSVFFALSFYRRMPILVSFGVAMVGLVPFFLYGIVPHYLAFSLFLSAVIGCYGQSLVQRNYRRKKKKERKSAKEKKKALTTAQRLEFAAGNGSFGVIVAAMMLGITMGTAVFIYNRPIIQMDQVRATIDKIATEASNFLFQERYEKQLNIAGYMRPDEHLSLHAPTWRHLKVLGVTSTTDTPIYLRYRTTVDLEEDGWTVADEEFIALLNAGVDQDFCENTQFYNYLKLTAPSKDPQEAGLDHIKSEEEGYINDRITVFPQYKVSDLLALPKGAVTNLPLSEYEGLIREGDTMLRYTKTPSERSYVYQTTSPLFTSQVFLTNFAATQEAYLALRNAHSKTDEYMGQELEYSRFVARNYLDLPDGMMRKVKTTAEEITAPYKTKLEKVQALERYFRTNFTYSTERQRLVREDGTELSAMDTIHYFLFTNEEKNGYCTLFASSMAIMARTLGYPARVASGYYAKPLFNDVDNYGVALYDSDYHAWTEIYFDGIGWVAFEPTPDYGVEPNYYLLELVDEGRENELKPEVEIVYIDDPDFIKYSNDLPDPTLPEEEEDKKNNTTTPTNPVAIAWGSWLKPVLLILLGILLIVALFVATEAVHRRTLLRMRRLSPKEGVRRGYDMTLRLMQLYNLRFFEGELLEEFAVRADNLKFVHIRLQAVVPIFQKALYSDLPLAEEERSLAADYVEALDRAAFNRANIFKGFWFKWTLWVKPRYKKMIWRFE